MKLHLNFPPNLALNPGDVWRWDCLRRRLTRVSNDNAVSTEVSCRGLSATKSFAAPVLLSYAWLEAIAACEWLSDAQTLAPASLSFFLSFYAHVTGVDSCHTYAPRRGVALLPRLSNVVQANGLCGSRRGKAAVKTTEPSPQSGAGGGLLCGCGCIMAKLQNICVEIFQ